MIIRVLGAAAGGGFPQWNCNCRNCAAVRAGKPGFRARTQASIAVSANDADWVLLNASPDLRQQINENPPLAAIANGHLRNSPIKAVVITNGDVDAIAGLLTLRELEPFALYAPPRILDILAANSVFNVLSPVTVGRLALPLDRPVPLTQADRGLGLTVEAFAVPGKVALYLEDETAGVETGARSGDTIALEVSDPLAGTRFFYVPSCAALDARLGARIEGAPLVFFDGTLYTDSEMIDQGLMQKTGARMGHMSMDGPQGSLSALRDLNVARRVFIHINNSNPVLDENSEARRATETEGWEVAHDGMEIRL